MGYNEIESGGVWKPTTIGDTFEGILKSRKTISGNNNKDYVQFTFEKLDNGEEYRISGAVLESKLAQVEDGSRVRLMYKGKPKGTYLDFTVMVWDEDNHVV